MNFVDISLVLCSPFHSPSNWTQSSLTLLTIHIHFNHPLSILCHSSHLTLQRHQLHGGHAQGWGRPRLGRQVHAGRRVCPWEDVQVCDDDDNDDLTWMYRSGLGLSLRADILSLDPGALSLMSGLSGLDGVSLHSLEALQRLKCPPDPAHGPGPPPLIRPDPTHPPSGSNVRTMATKERD